MGVSWVYTGMNRVRMCRSPWCGLKRWPLPSRPSPFPGAGGQPEEAPTHADQPAATEAPPLASNEAPRHLGWPVGTSGPARP